MPAAAVAGAGSVNAAVMLRKNALSVIVMMKTKTIKILSRLVSTLFANGTTRDYSQKLPGRILHPREEVQDN